MIQKEDIISYLQQTDTPQTIDKEDLKSVIELYPYCEKLRWIYLKLLYQNNDITFEKELVNHGIYITNHKALYFYLTETDQEKENTDKTLSIEQLTAGMGDYFSKPEPTEAQRESLQLMAQKLKEARLKRKEEIEKREKNQKETIGTEPAAGQKSAKRQTIPTKTNKSLTINEEEEKIITDTVNRLITEKKYLDALEILQSINLNNSKKSSYFALQIKYLETILKTTQK